MYLTLPVCLPEGIVTCAAAFQLNLTPSMLRIITDAATLAKRLEKERRRFVSLDYSFSEAQKAWLEVESEPETFPAPLGPHGFHLGLVIGKVRHLESTQMTVMAGGNIVFSCYTNESDELSAGPIWVETVSDPRTIWIEAGRWIWRPQLNKLDQTITLPDGYNGHTAKFFATPTQKDADSVRLSRAEPGKDYQVRWCSLQTYETALSAQQP
jgi:hypothetical protein